MAEIHGFWHKLQDRCDYCHRVAKAIYIVSSGPCTGKFCSALHYDLARKAMATNQIPEHEVVVERDE